MMTMQVDFGHFALALALAFVVDRRLQPRLPTPFLQSVAAPFKVTALVVLVLATPLVGTVGGAVVDE